MNNLPDSQCFLDMEGLLGRSRLGLTESLPFHAFQRLQRGEFIDDNILFAAIAVVMVKTALAKQRCQSSVQRW